MKLCMKCARLGNTCCQRSDVLVTVGDIRRISDFAHSQDFFEFRIPRDPSYLDPDGDPDWQKYTVAPDGSRRVLKKTLSGDCFFLGSAGCVLPMDVRPLVCRLYPLTYSASGISGFYAECPLHLMEPDESVDQLTGIPPEVAVSVHDLLYQEIKSGP
ncbi:MAG: hypothetical protein AB1921_08000 [Thermodesulfobacteriota bacterium]